ncbi:MAG: hypothetical protein KGS61_04695 [Verrucomicrobia bacterium]|nr:hypothetical protein [Verrucomicrobiota bacterium]
METPNPLASAIEPVRPPAEGELSLVMLSRAYRRLEVQFVALLLTLVVVCGSLNLFLLRQVSLVRRDLERDRPVVENALADYVRNGEPAIRDLLTKLEAFSKTHPDFRPILARYVSPSNASAAPLPSRVQPGR